MGRLRRGLIAVGLVALLGVGPGCSREPTHPNLLLVTVDTLRPDRLGFGGHERPTSPALDRLAAEGVRFERSYSQSGWTLPSLATVLTGRHPSRHGAVAFDAALDPGLPTLATLLRQRGYDTRAFVSHVLLRPQYGLARGFARYDGSVLEVGHPHRVATAKPLTDRAIRALDEVRPPFFLWVHYFDPHFLYLRHPEFAGFGDSDLDRYDGEIAHTDEQVGRLLDALREHGREDDTVVVFTADHGEAFGENGAYYHDDLGEPVARTPLVVKAPGLAPGVRHEPAQQIDLLPTVLARLGVPTPEGLPGRDLLAPDGAERPVFMERVDPSPWLQRAVVRGRHKLVVNVRVEGAQPPADRPRGPTVRPGVFLYDLEDDPGETTNLFDPESEVARELLALLHEHFAGLPDAVGRAVEVDEDLREKLRALGYAP
jgi:arylsulfatase A-like enzyme